MNGKEKRVLGVEAIIVDMDGTAVHYENEPFHSSWDALAEIFSGEDRQRWIGMKDKYYSKPELYQQWFEEQVSILVDKKVHVNDARKALFPIPYSKGFVEFFSMRNGFKKGILSKGFFITADEIAREFGFDYVFVDRLEIDKNGFFTGKSDVKSFSLDKSEELKEMIEKMQVKSQRVCYVGDSVSDISCFEIVGVPVLFNPKGPERDMNIFKEYINRKGLGVIYDFRELDNLINLDNRR